MAVVVEYQAWDSASYNWLDNTTSTSAPVQINNKLDAWVAAVNANASNTNKQITVEKDPSDSTSTNFVGWVLKLASDSANSTTYLALFTNGSSSLLTGAYSAWSTGTTNGGYGTLGGSSTATTGTTFYTSGYNAEFIVATETSNTEEFFCLGVRTNSASTTGSGCLLIFKDSTGEWATLTSWGSANYGSFYLGTHASPTRQYGITVEDLSQTLTTGFLDPLVLGLANTSFLPSAGNAVTVCAVPKSPYLLASGNFSTGYSFARYATLPGPRTAVCMGYSPIFVSYA